MNVELAKKPTVLVAILPGNEYKRYKGRTLTNHVRSESPLTAEEVEWFRVSPEETTEPEAA